MTTETRRNATFNFDWFVITYQQAGNLDWLVTTRPLIIGEPINDLVVVPLSGSAREVGSEILALEEDYGVDNIHIYCLENGMTSVTPCSVLSSEIVEIVEAINGTTVDTEGNTVDENNKQQVLMHVKHQLGLSEPVDIRWAEQIVNEIFYGTDTPME